MPYFIARLILSGPMFLHHIAGSTMDGDRALGYDNETDAITALKGINHPHSNYIHHDYRIITKDEASILQTMCS